MLSCLSSQLKGLDVRRYPAYSSTCLDVDSYTELKERLVSLATCYRTQPDLEESTDSD